MSDETDVVKDRANEAAGALTGNDKLRAQGKTNVKHWRRLEERELPQDSEQPYDFDDDPMTLP